MTPFIFVSILQSRDVLSYFVAVESFVRYINPCRIIIIFDPTITEANCAVFSQHIPQKDLHDEMIDGDKDPDSPLIHGLNPDAVRTPLL